MIMDEYRPIDLKAVQLRKKVDVRYITCNAIRRGELTKTNCYLCGTYDNMETHHTSYNNYDDVMWLCRSCHHRIHKYLRKTAIQIPIDWHTNGKGESAVFVIGYPGRDVSLINTAELHTQWNILKELFPDKLTLPQLIINELLICAGDKGYLNKSANDLIEVLSVQECNPDCMDDYNDIIEGAGYTISLIIKGTDINYYTPKQLDTEVIRKTWNNCRLTDELSLLHIILNEVMICAGIRVKDADSWNTKYYTCSHWNTIKDTDDAVCVVKISSNPMQDETTLSEFEMEHKVKI